MSPDLTICTHKKEISDRQEPKFADLNSFKIFQWKADGLLADKTHSLYLIYSSNTQYCLPQIISLEEIKSIEEKEFLLSFISKSWSWSRMCEKFEICYLSVWWNIRAAASINLLNTGFQWWTRHRFLPNVLIVYFQFLSAWSTIYLTNSKMV